MGDYIVMGIVGILVLVMSVLPKTVYNGITYTFSMHKYGIRKIQRYRTTTDSIANLIIGILVVFSIFYCFIPFYSVVYAILFILSYFCLLAQVNRVTSKKTQQVARTVILLNNIFAGVCFLGALGFMNGHMADGVINQFMCIKYLVFYTFYKIVLGCIGCFKAYYFYSHYLSCGRILNICV